MQTKEKTLEYSIKEGAAHSVMVGTGEHYISPYAIAMGASNRQIGLLTAFPQLIGSISVLLSSNIVERFKNRKTVVTSFALLQALMWIAIISVIFFRSNSVWFLILFVTIYWSCSLMSIPPWSSWIGDLVPDRIKGRYFGKRNKINGIFAFASMIIAGFILQLFSDIGVFYGFILIFIFAMVAKLISWRYLRKMHEPFYAIPHETRHGFFNFVKNLRKTNYGTFVLYLCLMRFSVQIAAPFFSAYFLRDLRLNYFEYMIITSVGTISSFLAMTVWGKNIDRFGNKRILMLTGFIVPIVPILFLFSTNIFYIVLSKIFAGFIWAGFNLSSFNFMFDTVLPINRVKYVSYYNTLNGVSIFLGASLGGYLVKFGTMFWSSFYFVFLISGIMRFVSSMLMLPRIREVKEVEKITEIKLFWSIMTIDVMRGLTHPIIFLRERRSRIARTLNEKVIRVVRKLLKKTFEK